MIVTYPDIHKLGYLDIVLKDLSSQGLTTEVFEDLGPNPRQFNNRRKQPE